MSLRKTLLFMLLLMCIITTIHILWISILYATTGLNINPHLEMDQLYQYPLVSFISVLPTLLFVIRKEITNLEWKIRVISHGILTFAFALVSWILVFSDWRSWTQIGNLLRFGTIFTVIYVFAYQTFVQHQRMLANKFNEQIKKRKAKFSLLDDAESPND